MGTTVVTVDGLEALRDAVTAWRDAKCTGVAGGKDLCDGENHLADCPVELARQDVLSTHDKVRV